MPDELDDLLGPKPGDVSPHIRGALLTRTQRHLVRVKWTRRLTKAAAVAAVFAGGGVMGWLAKPDRTAVEVAVAPPEVVVVPVIVPVPESAPSAPGPVAALTPGKLELLAEQADDPAEAGKLYRRAGDAYLNDTQDYRNATRCYRLFLTRGGDAALSLDPGDSWLLTSLKNAAFQEKLHAANSGG